MCSIFGLAFPHHHDVSDNYLVKRITDGLFVKCMARGTHASGLAYVSEDNVTVVKKNVPGDQFIRLPEYTESFGKYGRVYGANTRDGKRTEMMSLLGHCRWETQGSRIRNNNNHPIIRNKVVGTHNGTISNDHMLFVKHNADFKRYAEVDSEIIFALIEHYAEDMKIHEAIQKATNEFTGSFACSMVHVDQPHLLWLFRGFQPCVIHHYIDLGMIIWASAASFINETVKDLALGTYEDIAIGRETGLVFDLNRNKIQHFDLSYEETNANAE